MTGRHSRRNFLRTSMFLTAAGLADPKLMEGELVSSGGVKLGALPEYLRPDPFGAVVPPDRLDPQGGTELIPWQQVIKLKGARGGYVSFHLLIELPETGNYTLHFDLADKTQKLQVDLFREWFHRTGSGVHYYPDALVPVSNPCSSAIPEEDNQIGHQTTAAYWVDIWIPADAEPGPYRGRASLTTPSRRLTLPFELTVLPIVIPAGDAITVDHNTYYSSWVAGLYPETAKRAGPDFCKSNELFRVLQAHHRLFYEHRGTFHDLGYGHAGKIQPGFAPELKGWGRGKQVASWDLFDRLHGPLFDGSAFAATRRGPRPIPSVYLPINPDWPASFLWWGEPGYEAEFVGVVAEMERHFREKGWTHTNFEMFFNHKVYLKGYPWDGDETKCPDQVHYFIEYGRLLTKALPGDSPVKFVFRADTSWRMEQDFDTLSGIIKFWVCNGDILSWFPTLPQRFKQRSDRVWFYKHLPRVTQTCPAISFWPLRAWIYGVDGLEYWQTTDPGGDPWFHFEGGETAVVYPGERFGIPGPIPSVRLKIQRNTLQDLALLIQLQDRFPAKQLQAEVTRRYNGTEPADWWFPPPPMVKLPPENWTGRGILESVDGPMGRLQSKVHSRSWQNVRDYLWSLVSEGQ